MAVDGDPSGWRDRVRDRATWTNPAALRELAKEADVAAQPVHLLVALGTSLSVQDGVDFLRRIQAAHPDDFYANLMLALWLMRSSGHDADADADDAVGFFRAAVALRPGSARAHYHLALGLRAAGRPDKAVDSLRRAIALDPADAWPHVVLGTVFHETGRPDDALRHLQAAVRLDPTYVRAQAGLAVVLHAQ